MTTTTILASNVDEAHARIAKANKKLAKAGIADRFELTVGEPYAVKISGGPGELPIDIFKVDVELNTPEIAYAGWTFVATLVAEGDDLITRVVPGEELGGWAPETAVCDHCHTLRPRSKTYIVRNADSTVKQVGSSCIRLFLGVSPAALWALDYDPIDDLNADDDHEFGFSSHNDRAYDVRYLIKLAYVLTDGGKGYVSRAATEFGGQSTADEVFYHLSDNHPRETLSERISREIMLDEAAKLPETVVDEVLASVDTLDQNTDYGRNLAILAGKEFISRKSVGLLVSILTVFCKDRQRKAAKAEIASGFIGAVGTKITNLEVTVQAIRYLDGYMPGSTSTLLVMRTADNHVVKWFASRKIEIDEGDKIVIKSATVKANEVWQGQDQTAITRARIA